MKLSQFAEKYAPNPQAIINLIKEFEAGFPPSKKHFPKSDYVAKIYKSKLRTMPEIGILSAMVEKVFLPIFTLRNGNEYLFKIFGVRVDSQENAMKAYLFSYASLYKLMHAGACSFRASYAALHFALYLPNLEIKLLSMPERDQFIVQLSDKNDLNQKKYVYDPLTNPEEIFEKDFYVENILTTFPLSSKKALKFEMIVTKEIAGSFNERWSYIQSELIQILRKANFSQKFLLRDPSFFMGLLNEGIQPDEFGVTINKFTKLIDDIISDNENNCRAAELNNNRVGNNNILQNLGVFGQFSEAYKNLKKVALSDTEKQEIHNLRKI